MGDGAHALHEHVVEADLPWRAAFLAALLDATTLSHGEIKLTVRSGRTR